MRFSYVRALAPSVFFALISTPASAMPVVGLDTVHGPGGAVLQVEHVQRQPQFFCDIEVQGPGNATIKLDDQMGDACEPIGDEKLAPDVVRQALRAKADEENRGVITQVCYLIAQQADAHGVGGFKYVNDACLKDPTHIRTGTKGNNSYVTMEIPGAVPVELYDDSWTGDWVEPVRGSIIYLSSESKKLQGKYRDLAGAEPLHVKVENLELDVMGSTKEIQGDGNVGYEALTCARTYQRRLNKATEGLKLKGVTIEMQLIEDLATSSIQHPDLTPKRLASVPWHYQVRVRSALPYTCEGSDPDALLMLIREDLHKVVAPAPSGSGAKEGPTAPSTPAPTVDPTPTPSPSVADNDDSHHTVPVSPVPEDCHTVQCELHKKAWEKAYGKHHPGAGGAH
ncbi:MAG TPA: hypothetical protein VL588_01695 [Bdellovibrionota bacterium]|nr:hypothetical protein [Bdellovibrionota bacterium]